MGDALGDHKGLVVDREIRVAKLAT